jgi:hypothetical protein
LEQELKLKERPIFWWLVGFAGIAWGGYAFVTTLPAINFNAIFALTIGVLIAFFNYGLTVTADKGTGMLTLDYRSVFLHSVKEIPLRDIQSIRVDSSTSQGRKRGSRNTSYRVEAVLKNNERIPFRSYYSGNFIKYQDWANKLRAHLGLGEALDETPMGIIRAASKLGSDAARIQQEAFTGPNAEMRVTDGVNWQVQTFGMGASPGARWFSPDVKTQSGFLFLAQKIPGQSSSGFLASLGKTLFKQSISLYGFSSSDTPNLATADQYASLSPALDRHFSAFTSDPAEARQILNPWTQTPLAAWGERYPLQQFQSNTRFTQIVVLFSPNGIHIATLGILPPDKLEEITQLGVELVKAQKM